MAVSEASVFDPAAAARRAGAAGTAASALGLPRSWRVPAAAKFGVAQARPAQGSGSPRARSLPVREGGSGRAGLDCTLPHRTITMVERRAAHGRLAASAV